VFSALPMGVGDKIPFSNLSWSDFINYQTWKNKLRYGALPIDEQLKQAQLEALKARTGYYTAEASRTRALAPSEASYYYARASSLLPEVESFPPDLVSALLSFLPINQLLGSNIGGF